MFDLGSIASSVLDYADGAASAVLGGIKTAGTWMQDNPGAATLLGSALVAGGSYLENRDTLKRQREDRDAEWKHKDEYAMPASAGLDFTVVPGEVSGMQDGVLTNGLLAGMSKQKKG